MEINLIGMTVEEALHEADKFIDNGVMNGQTTLYLIHGKGTGALRKGIHEHLRRHKMCAASALAFTARAKRALR